MTRSQSLFSLSCFALMSIALGGCDHAGTYTCLRYFAEVGQACGPQLGCVDDASCVDGVCELRGGLGDACDVDAGLYCSSASEDDDESCGEGLACQTTTEGGPHRCLPPVGEGDSCREGQTCGANTYCDVDRDAPELAFSLAP